MTNAIADEYITLQRTSEYDAARRASDWLEARVPELRAKSEAAQRAMVEYKNEHNIVESGGSQSINDQSLADLNARLNTAHDETLKAKARIDQLATSSGAAVTNTTDGIDARDATLESFAQSVF